MKSSVRAAFAAVGVRQKINLVTRVEHRVGIIFFTAWRFGEARASGVVTRAPVPFDLRVLPRIVFTAGGDQDAGRGPDGDSGVTSGIRVEDIFVVGVTTYDGDANRRAVLENGAERVRAFRFVLELNQKTEIRVITTRSEKVLMPPVDGRSTYAPQIKGDDLTRFGGFGQTTG